MAGVPALVARTGYTGRGRLRGLRRRRGRRRRSGTRSLEAGRAARAACRSGSAPATRSGSRPACRSTATSSTATTNALRGRPRPGRQARPRRATSWAATRSRGSPRRARAAPRRPRACAGRGIARHGYPVWSGERRQRRGHQRHPCRRRSASPIAMAYVAPADCAARYDARRARSASARAAAEVVPLPFYRRAR